MLTEKLMVAKSVDRSILKRECVDLFRAAIKSPATLDPYERRLISFLRTINLSPDEFVKLAKKDPGSTEKKILSFILSQKLRAEQGEITTATVGNSLKAVRLLLEMNDVSLNWKKIRRILPRVRRYALDRIPTITEIREIIDAADLRGRALTLVFISSGIREGAIETLKVADYTHIERDKEIIAGRLIVYNKDPERYTTFITPEACFALDKYLNFRKENCEELNGDSPLFRDKFDPIKERYGRGKVTTETKVIAITAPSVRQYYNRLLYSIGIRIQKRRRHDFSVHGFRKFFKTKSEIAGMKPINVETLMGHSVGISDSYYRPTERDLLEDYLKIIDHLSVIGETRLKMELEEINIARKQLEALNKGALSSMSDQIIKLAAEVREMKSKKY